MSGGAATRVRYAVAAGILAAAWPAAWLIAAPCEEGAAPAFSETERARILQHSPLPDPPADPTNEVADHPLAARLGQFLFFEPRLSSRGDISCATCHDPSKHFTDGKPLGEGIRPGSRHTPALWNVAHQRWFFWDGRADTLWAQALGPIEHPDEMAGSRVSVARLIALDGELRRAYERVFPEERLDPTWAERLPAGGRPVAGDPSDPQHRAWLGLSEADRDRVNRVFANVGKVIAAYERRLVSRSAPFDTFVEGLREGDSTKLSALSASAQRGLKLFIGRGDCRLCHTGPVFSDGEFHSARVAPRDGAAPRDAGRYDGIELAQRSEFSSAGPYSDDPDGPAAAMLRHLKRKGDDWGRFKTPSLRNVAVTAPYMHQGQFATLDDVLRHYSKFENALPPDHHRRETVLMPLNFSEQEAADLKAFLESLTDVSIEAKLLRRPASPLGDE